MVPVVAGCLLAGTVTSGTAAAAAPPAAKVGTFTVGPATTVLSQPAQPGIGSLVPAPDAAVNGMFGPQVAWPLIPLHAALARDGHLISFGTPVGRVEQGGLAYDDWDPAAGFARAAHVDTASMRDYDSFCNSLVTLDDGRLLMVGGNSTMRTMIYDPRTRTQTRGADFAFPRWYATTLRLPDGRILVLGGGVHHTGNWVRSDDNSGLALTPEIGSGTGAWTALPGAASEWAFDVRDSHWWYPRSFVAPDGNVFGMSGDRLWSLSTKGEGSVRRLGTLPFNPKVSGSQVMYEPGRILVAGGGQWQNASTEIATASAATVDINGGAPAVRSIAPMRFPRNWLNLTVLPTGEVLANGGTRIGTNGGEANSIKQAEIWSPATGTWRTAATARRTRTYHSTSLLLPSGAVFTGGGGAPGPESNLNAELYYPAYLFAKGADGAVRWASRPEMTAISGSATYGGRVTLTLRDSRAIKQVSLITLPSVTHGQNTDQRRVPLTFSQRGGTLTAALPTAVNTLPPGDYELTVTDAKGVPSPAQILTIRRGAPGLVTVGTTAAEPAASKPAKPAASEPAKPGTMPERAASLKIGGRIGLEPVDQRGSRITHVGSAVRVQRVGSASSKAAKLGSSWIVRPGLASAKGVSFESVDKPGYYLALKGPGSRSVGLVRSAGSRGSKSRATFAAVKGASGGNTSLVAFSHRTLYLRHVGKRLSVGALTSSKLRRAGSTFTIRRPLGK